MGGLGKSLAAFVAGVRFETQVDIHVMLQLNPGPKLLVTPGDKPHSQYSAYAANEQIVPRHINAHKTTVMAVPVFPWHNNVPTLQ